MSVQLDIVKLMKKAGYKIKRRSNHIIWVNSRGQVVVTPSSTANWRWVPTVKLAIKRNQGA